MSRDSDFVLDPSASPTAAAAPDSVPESTPDPVPDLAPQRTADERGLEALAHELGISDGVDRRRFVKLAAGVAAGLGLAPGALRAEELRARLAALPPGPAAPPPGPAGTAATGAGPVGAGPVGDAASPASALAREAFRQALQTPLGNGEPPAFTFQAWPGGTGALLERLHREYGDALFQPTTVDVEPWSGPVPATEEELAFLPVHRQAALIKEGRIAPTELTDIYLERIKRYDPVLLFAVTILEGRAREEAQQAEADLRSGGWKGPLHGIPYGLKDLFTLRGTPTTWGSGDFQDQVIDEDAEVAVRLREAGAVLVAKLATGEFARGDNWYRGQTKNPWNLEQGSSGSSAGPSSATAAGCVAFGIGTETQGSIISPARRCGLSALRPTFGRVSRHGGMVLAWSMDKVGPICRTIEDCALVFAAIHGSDEKDPSTLTTPFRFRRDIDLSSLVIAYEESAPESFVEALRALGADPRPLDGLPQGSSNALSVESAAAFDFYVAPQLEAAARTGEELEGGRFTGGRETSALDFVQSQRRRYALQLEVHRALGGIDLFVSGGGQIGLTNQTGHPSVVVPFDFDGDPSQPRTTMLVGQPFADDVILSVAHRYQTTTDWHQRRPDLSGVQ